MKTFSISDFDYPLPAEQIAFRPAEKRDASKLLVWKNSAVKHDTYANIADHLPSNATLFFNNTKVIAARMFFEKASGGKIEILLLEPANGSYASLYDKKISQWKCLVGGLKKWKQHEAVKTRFTKNGTVIEVEAKWIEKQQEVVQVLFSWNNEALSFADIVEAAGNIPLPPYIKREATVNDKERYQTIYAAQQGSVAAPTAGLHFTDEIFASLRAKKIDPAFITLHVGAGTFKPVSSESIAEHIMHEEYIEVDKMTIRALMDEQKFIIPVGTTSMRTIESLYWMSIKVSQPSSSGQEMISLGQWEHLSLSAQHLPSRRTAMNNLLQFMEHKGLDLLCGRTSICITPGYTFMMSAALVTNFHQPKSTLLLLIAAIMGEDWKRTYALALDEGYRFLSYGDGCLLFINGQKNGLSQGE